MDIALYISDLLQKHDEISVSGLGTFSTKYGGAKFDDQMEAFIPPGKRIEYSPDSQPDSRLAEYISELRHISIESSKHFIERFAEEIQNRLNSGQAAELAGIGTLHKTDAGISFLTSPASRKDHSSFGLQPVRELKRSTISAPNWDPVILNELPAAEQEDEESDAPIKRRKFPVLLIILILLASGAAALYFFTPNTVNYFTKAPVRKTVVPAAKPKTLTDSVTVADSIIQSLDQQGFEVEKPRDTITISTEAKPASAPTITFEVIGASLNSQKDADHLVKNFRSKGLDARIILAKDKKRNNILISLASFNTKDAAGAELIRIKNDIEPGAYIYTYNHN